MPVSAGAAQRTDPSRPFSARRRLLIWIAFSALGLAQAVVTP